jgi:hypothetical protein
MTVQQLEIEINELYNSLILQIQQFEKSNECSLIIGAAENTKDRFKLVVVIPLKKIELLD